VQRRSPSPALAVARAEREKERQREREREREELRERVEILKSQLAPGFAMQTDCGTDF